MRELCANDSYVKNDPKLCTLNTFHNTPLSHCKTCDYLTIKKTDLYKICDTNKLYQNDYEII